MLRDVGLLNQHWEHAARHWRHAAPSSCGALIVRMGACLLLGTSVLTAQGFAVGPLVLAPITEEFGVSGRESRHKAELDS